MKDVDVARSIIMAMLISGVVLFIFGGGASGAESIQLVGSFSGINCEPEDPANDMDSVGVGLWRKLKFIDEPGRPDTIYFKFTADGSYLPEHWGWSLADGWGTAALAWSPPSIAAVLPDSGYWYFHFDEVTYEYWLSRPDGSITGTVATDSGPGAPAGAAISLFDSDNELIGTLDGLSAAEFGFTPLPPGEYRISAFAPGYEDVFLTGIEVTAGSAAAVDISFTPLTAVWISGAFTEDVEGGFMLTWITGCCDASTRFDVYRGDSPELAGMEKRNAEPVRSPLTEFRFFDECAGKDVDHYYYIIELGVDDGAVYGPVAAPATAMAASRLGQNFPNPFNPVTTIPFYVSRDSSYATVSIAFFDVAGRLVDSHDLGNIPAGDHSFEWNPSLSIGRDLPSGVYYCRLAVGKEFFTRKMIMLR